jgi:hypothetical protein
MERGLRASERKASALTAANTEINIFAITIINRDAKPFTGKYVDFLNIIHYMPCCQVMYLDSSPIGVTA